MATSGTSMLKGLYEQRTLKIMYIHKHENSHSQEKLKNIILMGRRNLKNKTVLHWKRASTRNFNLALQLKRLMQFWFHKCVTTWYCGSQLQHWDSSGTWNSSNSMPDVQRGILPSPRKCDAMQRCGWQAAAYAKHVSVSLHLWFPTLEASDWKQRMKCQEKICGVQGNSGISWKGIDRKRILKNKGNNNPLSLKSSRLLLSEPELLTPGLEPTATSSYCFLQIPRTTDKERLRMYTLNSLLMARRLWKQ